MDNVLIDDRRIHVDFSQSVAKTHTWKRAGAGPPPTTGLFFHSVFASFTLFLLAYNSGNSFWGTPNLRSATNRLPTFLFFVFVGSTMYVGEIFLEQ